MKLINIIIIGIVSHFTYAASISYNGIDSYVDSIAVYNYNTIDELLKNLIKSEWDEREKTRAIFYWIASNIKYDKEGFINGYWSKYNSYYELASETYSLRKGICGGYSQLFKYMCDKIGIESKVIDGFSRTEFYQAGLPIEIPNHSWNVVKINGKWQLIDVTWASSTALETECNDYYFLTPPNEFITNHFPEDIKWQLLKEPITKDEYDKYPYISSDYFILQQTKSYPRNGRIKLNRDTLSLNIVTPENCSPLIKFFSYQNKDRVKIEYKKQNIELGQSIDIYFKESGRYLLRIDYFENREAGFKIYKRVLGYTIIKE